MKRKLPIVVWPALAAVFIAAAPVSAETILSLDAYIAAKRLSLAANCKTLEFAEGFARKVDADGDGRGDLLIDYHAALCNESSMYFCGSGGCEMEVYLGDAARAFTLLAPFFGYAIDFDRPDASPPSFVVALHGNECGVSGMSPCAIRYKIEGGKAVEAGEVDGPDDE